MKNDFGDNEPDYSLANNRYTVYRDDEPQITGLKEGLWPIIAVGLTAFCVALVIVIGF